MYIKNTGNVFKSHILPCVSIAFELLSSPKTRVRKNNLHSFLSIKIRKILMIVQIKSQLSRTATVTVRTNLIYNNEAPINTYVLNTRNRQFDFLDSK